MTNSDVKQRITSLQGLPVLPPVAREILLALDTGALHWDELAAVAALDEAVARTVRSAATAEFGVNPGAPLETHLEALGLPRVAELVLQLAATGLFDAPQRHGIDLDAFWKHAFSVARYARAIARKIDSGYAPLAYAAGFLHDIGKPALDRVASGGYSRALELVRQQGLYALEAERRELGADHALAGKWLAESWGLPAKLATTIWLHHHPPGSLDNTPYPVPLIEIVALANALAHGDNLEAPPQERVAAMDEQRWTRLGLERVDVVELLRGDTAEGHQPPASALATSPVAHAAPGEDAGRLRQERDFYVALCEFHEGMAPGLDTAGQLRLLIGSLRKAFGIPAGLCYLNGDLTGEPVVLRWHNLAGDPEIVPVHGGGAMSAPLDALIGNLQDATGAEGEAGAVHRHGFMALPLLYNNRNLGQLIFQAGQGGPPLSEHFFNGLMRFMKAAGAALARCNAIRGANEEAESLAAAVWKQEISHRNDRRTERLISVGKMAAGAAHEINNPLAVISGKAQLLLGRAERPDDRKSLETIIEHSQRASGILRDLLQFAKPNPPQLMPSRLGSLLRGALDKVRSRLEEEGIQLVEDYAPDLPLVHVDRVQMDQVFHNILENAEYAMARQGEKLIVRVRPNQDRTAVIIQIIDTGQGISADVMDKVFEPFFTTRAGNQGTGMGLAVCHGIVEAHRGTITLHSQEGAGTTCTLTLPVSADAAPAPADTDSSGVALSGVSPDPGRATTPAPTPAPATATATGQPSETPKRPAPETPSPGRPDQTSDAPTAKATSRESYAPSRHAADAPYTDPQPGTAHPPTHGEPGYGATSPPPRREPGYGATTAPAAKTPPRPAPAATTAPEVNAAMRTRSEPEPPRSRAKGEGRGNLLLVDQDSELREVLAEALRNRGYRVQTATDGLEALAEVIAHRVDLVLVDGGVPGVNPPQTLVDEIQRRKPNLPVILLIGAAARHESATGAGEGLLRVLRKPFEVAQLFEMIEESIAARNVA